MSVEGSKVLRFPRTIRAPEEPRGPEVGDVVAAGRYALLDCLGEGGLGTVFLADDLAMSRRVAIKTLVPRYIGRREREQRLFDEYRYLERVKDRRHVVAAIECGRLAEFDGWPFMVMEHVDGMSLFRRMLQGRRMTPAEIIEIGLQTARGIQAIHRVRVVHRDITPQNLLLLEDGQRTTVKIIDFSHGADADAKKLTAGEHGRLTGMHEVPGTAQYMPPEQVNAKAADPRMDIYSFGIVLHEMITGRNPFAGMSRDVYIDRQRQDALQVDPLDPRVYPDLPESLLRLVGRCLRESPAGRPAIELVVRRFEAMHVEGDRFEAARTQPRLVRPVIEVGEDEGADALGIDDPPVAELGPVDSDLVVEAAAVAEASRLIESARVAQAAPASRAALVADVAEAGDAHDDAAEAAPADAGAEPSTRSPWTLVAVAAGAVLLVAVAVILWVWRSGISDEPRSEAALPATLAEPAAEELPDATPEPAPQPPSVPEPADEGPQAEDGPRAPEPAPHVDDARPAEQEPQALVEASPPPEPRRERRPAAGAAAAAKVKARCEGVVEAARAARTQRDWPTVVKLTGERSCWGSAPVDRLAWRVEALSELGRWEECAKLGAQAKDPQVRSRTDRCRARLGSHEDAQ